MLLASAASYPVVRGAAGMVGGFIDEARRRALVQRGALLTRHAAEAIPLVRPHLERIDQELQRLGIDGGRRYMELAEQSLQERVRWFSPSRIREFVEANHVESLVLCKELGDFLLAPVREAIDSTRHMFNLQAASGLEKQLRQLEAALIRFAAQKFEADISRPNEPSYMIRSWWLKAARISAILILGIAGLLVIAYLSIR
jgi:hypothetical protein